MGVPRWFTIFRGKRSHEQEQALLWHPPDLSGWLYVQGKTTIRNTCWEQKFLVLKGSNLFWFDAKGASEPRGFIPLEGATIARRTVSNRKRDQLHGLHVLLPRGTSKPSSPLKLVLAATSQELQTVWFRALSQASVPRSELYVRLQDGMRTRRSASESCANQAPPPSTTPQRESRLPTAFKVGFAKVKGYQPSRATRAVSTAAAGATSGEEKLRPTLVSKNAPRLRGVYDGTSVRSTSRAYHTPVVQQTDKHEPTADDTTFRGHAFLSKSGKHFVRSSRQGTASKEDVVRSNIGGDGGDGGDDGGGLHSRRSRRVSADDWRRTYRQSNSSSGGGGSHIYELVQQPYDGSRHWPDRTADEQQIRCGARPNTGFEKSAVHEDEGTEARMPCERRGYGKNLSSRRVVVYDGESSDSGDEHFVGYDDASVQIPVSNDPREDRNCRLYAGRRPDAHGPPKVDSQPTVEKENMYDCEQQPVRRTVRERAIKPPYQPMPHNDRSDSPLASASDISCLDAVSEQVSYDRDKVASLEVRLSGLQQTVASMHAVLVDMAAQQRAREHWALGTTTPEQVAAKQRLIDHLQQQQQQEQQDDANILILGQRRKVQSKNDLRQQQQQPLLKTTSAYDLAQAPTVHSYLQQAQPLAQPHAQPRLQLNSQLKSQLRSTHLRIEALGGARASSWHRTVMSQPYTLSISTASCTEQQGMRTSEAASAVQTYGSVSGAPTEHGAAPAKTGLTREQERNMLIEMEHVLIRMITGSSTTVMAPVSPICTLADYPSKYSSACPSVYPSEYPLDYASEHGCMNSHAKVALPSASQDASPLGNHQINVGYDGWEQYQQGSLWLGLPATDPANPGIGGFVANCGSSITLPSSAGMIPVMPVMNHDERKSQGRKAPYVPPSPRQDVPAAGCTRAPPTPVCGSEPCNGMQPPGPPLGPPGARGPRWD